MMRNGETERDRDIERQRKGDELRNKDVRYWVPVT